jgi:hypothetical protein
VKSQWIRFPLTKRLRKKRRLGRTGHQTKSHIVVVNGSHTYSLRSVVVNDVSLWPPYQNETHFFTMENTIASQTPVADAIDYATNTVDPDFMMMMQSTCAVYVFMRHTQKQM